MQITDKIHLLRIDFDIQISAEKKLSRFVNILIILDKKITLIDTGVKGSEKQIFEYIKKCNRDYSEIGTIILSHSHPDHIGSAARIKELTNCKIFAHELEKDWIENIDLQLKERPVPGFYELVDRSVQVDMFISHNQSIALSEQLTIRIIASFGHSKGSINVLFEEENLLFTADSIPLKNDIPNYDDYNQLMKSLEMIKKFSTSKKILTSWTPPVLDKEEMAKTIHEGKEYMKRVDSVVNEYYKNKNSESLEFCKTVVERLTLPSIYVHPIVDKAFKSHL